jgi:predicted transcriptional regulator
MVSWWEKAILLNNRSLILLMTTKEMVVKAVSELPDDAEIEDAMERLLLLAKIERGLQQADAGETIPHDEVKQRVSKWLT